MFEFYKTGICIAAGIAGTLFIGYCIYFDHKRRKDPDYKKKLRERRNRIRTQKNAANGSRNNIPNMNDHEAIERYFLQEIQLGETQIARGHFESGVEHLANAIVVSGQPARLLQILQTSLPVQVFAMLIIKMQEFGNRAQQERARIVTSSGGGVGVEIGGGNGTTNAVLIDDLE